MNVLITGGTGFVGNRLCHHLLIEGHSVTAIGRGRRRDEIDHKRYRFLSADTTRPGAWTEAAAEADGVINLAGRSIFTRWTNRAKKAIVDSRLETTRNLVDALPDRWAGVLLSTSAVGYYGDRGDERLTESAAPGEGFLADLGRDWEAEAMRAADKGARVAIMRFGVVLGRCGGALDKMVPAFKMFLGGPLGGGNQWFPWIHIRDLVRAARYLLETPDLSGPFNFTAPEPLRNREFARTLGRVLGRPAVMPAPAVAIRAFLGEFGEVLLSSQRAVPQRLLDAGFSFEFPDAETALAHLLSE